MYFPEMFDLKMKYDESDFVLVRLTRRVTDKVGSVFGKFENNSYLRFVSIHLG